MLFRPTPPAPGQAAFLRGHTLDVLGLGVRYGAFTALDAVDLSVQAGEVLARVSRALRDQGFLAKLRGAGSADALYALLASGDAA